LLLRISPRLRRRSLESALRFYSCLTKGDIIEITYNSLIFEFLVMDTRPEGSGISIIDTDLEVDFETPVGYVEPPRPAPAPIPTMADKLKIDLGETTSVSAGSSRPVSSLSNRPGGSGDSTPLESFTGVGQSLSGRKVKGKGLAKKIEEVDPSSKINRNE
jgi:ubiquitin fusion degradation protein 1